MGGDGMVEVAGLTAFAHGSGHNSTAGIQWNSDKGRVQPNSIVQMSARDSRTRSHFRNGGAFEESRARRARHDVWHATHRNGCVFTKQTNVVATAHMRVHH